MLFHPRRYQSRLIALTVGGFVGGFAHADTLSGRSFGLDDPPVQVKSAGDALAPASSNSEEELAKKLSNPVASLISVPFQFNFDTAYGPKDANRWTLNFQPVVPLSLNDDYNLIIRTIVPVVYQESIADGVSSEFGLSDITQSFFFAPKETIGGWIIGVGPAFLWPAATDDSLGSEKWGIGPTLVALQQRGPWTYGVLLNHIWSYAGEDDRGEVNATFVQPFFSHTTKSAFTVTLNAESTYDWNASQWTVPINLMASQLVKIGDQPISIGIGGRYYADAPDDGPEWGIRFVVTFLFPK